MTFPRASTALQRFTVLDLTRVRAGPTCVRQLADWGANCIKIEMPEHMAEGEGMGGPRDGSDFQNLHRNKRSITLNLKSPEGVAVLKKMAAKADVVVENYRPDVKRRLGIDYDRLTPEQCVPDAARQLPSVERRVPRPTRQPRPCPAARPRQRTPAVASAQGRARPAGWMFSSARTGAVPRYGSMTRQVIPRSRRRCPGWMRTTAGNPRRGPHLRADPGHLREPYADSTGLSRFFRYGHH